MSTTPFRRSSPIHVGNCTLAASFDFLGDRWSLLIVRSALFGIRRFDDFQTEIGIPRTVLATRLKQLVEAGILEKRDYREGTSRPRPEYLLTEMGEALRLPFLAMRQWSDRWVGAGRTPPMTVVRKSDGAPVHVALVDGNGTPVDPQQLAAAFQPWAAEPGAFSLPERD